MSSSDEADQQGKCLLELEMVGLGALQHWQASVQDSKEFLLAELVEEPVVVGLGPVEELEMMEEGRLVQRVQVEGLTTVVSAL